MWDSLKSVSFDGVKFSDVEKLDLVLGELRVLCPKHIHESKPNSRVLFLKIQKSWKNIETATTKLYFGYAATVAVLVFNCLSFSNTTQ